MTAKQHTITATILVIVGLYIVHLSKFEIQPWDEGLYVARGESVVRFGALIDQAPYSIGGEYSSTPAPLAAWGVAAGITVFGRNAFGARIFFILCSALCLYLLYSICMVHLSHRTSMIGVILLATAIPWVEYSRQAMSEIPLITGMLMCWLSVVRPYKSSRNELWSAGLFALGFSVTLLSKYLVGFLPLLLFVSAAKDKRLMKIFLIGGLVGAVLALPWYGHMMVHHSGAFFAAMFPDHITTAVEGNSGGGSYLYYVNKLVVGQPVLVFTVVTLVVYTYHRRQLSNDRWIVVAGLWLVCAGVIFSLSMTKNPHYSVLLFPPAVVTVLWGYERVVSLGSSFTQILSCIAIAAATVWAVIPSMRTSVKLLQPTPILLAVGIAAVVFGLIAYIVRNNPIVKRHSYTFLQRAIYVACAVGIIRTVGIVWSADKQGIYGAKAVASVLMESARFDKNFTYLYHEQNKADSLNPQLRWYTAGWMLGWDEGYSYNPRPMQGAKADVSVVATCVYEMAPFIVYYHPGVTAEERLMVATTAAIGYDVDEEKGYYTLFRRR